MPCHLVRQMIFSWLKLFWQDEKANKTDYSIYFSIHTQIHSRTCTLISLQFFGFIYSLLQSLFIHNYCYYLKQCITKSVSPLPHYFVACLFLSHSFLQLSCSQLELCKLLFTLFNGLVLLQFLNLDVLKRLNIQAIIFRTIAWRHWLGMISLY